MAFEGPHGVFIHIPKTGGTYIKKVLRQRLHTHRAGKTHSLPVDWDLSGETFYWATIRHPAMWLRSIWRNRLGERWQPFPHPDLIWARFCEITKSLQDNDFNEFAKKITNQLPGVLTWLHKSYTPPPVNVIRLENIHIWLYNNGYNPNEVIPNKATDLPELTIETLLRIYEAERYLYEKYGYLTNVNGELK